METYVIEPDQSKRYGKVKFSCHWRKFPLDGLGCPLTSFYSILINMHYHIYCWWDTNFTCMPWISNQIELWTHNWDFLFLLFITILYLHDLWNLQEFENCRFWRSFSRVSPLVEGFHYCLLMSLLFPWKREKNLIRALHVISILILKEIMKIEKTYLPVGMAQLGRLGLCNPILLSLRWTLGGV